MEVEPRRLLRVNESAANRGTQSHIAPPARVCIGVGLRVGLRYAEVMHSTEGLARGLWGQTASD